MSVVKKIRKPTKRYPNGQVRWAANVYDPTLKRGVWGKTFAKREDAARQELQMLANAKQGLPVFFGGTLGDVYEKWISEYKKTRAPRTVKNARYTWEHYLSDTFSQTKANKITKEIVEAFKQEMLRNGMKAETVKKALSVLSLIINHAIDMGTAVNNPVARVEKPPIQRTSERDTWTEVQVRYFVSHPLTKADKYGLAFTLTVATGMRVGEVCGLKSSDIDPTIGLIKIQRGIDNDGNETNLKTARSHRSVFIPEEIAGQLWIQGNGREYVFETMPGRPLRPDLMTKRFEKLVKKINTYEPRFVPKWIKEEPAYLAKISSPFFEDMKRLLIEQVKIDTKETISEEEADEYIRTLYAMQTINDRFPAVILPKIKGSYALRHTYQTVSTQKGISPIETALIMGDNPRTVLSFYTHPQGDVGKRIATDLLGN